MNLVNGPHMAEERGIEADRDPANATSVDFTESYVVRLHVGRRGSVEVAGTGVGPRNIPLPGTRVWGRRLLSCRWPTIWAIFRYTDQPGMIGRVGDEIFGEEGVNIVVGRGGG